MKSSGDRSGILLPPIASLLVVPFIHSSIPAFTHLFYRRFSLLQACPAARVRQELNPRTSAHSSCLSLPVRTLTLYLLSNSSSPPGTCALSHSYRVNRRLFSPYICPYLYSTARRLIQTFTFRTVRSSSDSLQIHIAIIHLRCQCD